jgi:beta-lactam-binding protein with PASTA domain
MNYKNTVWLLPFICFIIGYCAMSWLLRPAAMSMPSLINHSLHDATKIASEHHLNIRILREQENTQLAEGTVIDQIPSPKSLVKHYQTVFLVITKKAARPLAPHLLNLSTIKGQSVEHVQELAQQAGMRLTIQHAYPVPEKHECSHCHVYDQQPRSGSLFTADGAAHLVILVGP